MLPWLRSMTSTLSHKKVQMWNGVRTLILSHSFPFISITKRLCVYFCESVCVCVCLKILFILMYLFIYFIFISCCTCCLPLNFGWHKPCVLMIYLWCMRFILEPDWWHVFEVAYIDIMENPISININISADTHTSVDSDPSNVVVINDYKLPQACMQYNP